MSVCLWTCSVIKRWQDQKRCGSPDFGGRLYRENVQKNVQWRRKAPIWSHRVLPQMIWTCSRLGASSLQVGFFFVVDVGFCVGGKFLEQRARAVCSCSRSEVLPLLIVPCRCKGRYVKKVVTVIKRRGSLSLSLLSLALSIIIIVRWCSHLCMYIFFLFVFVGWICCHQPAVHINWVQNVEFRPVDSWSLKSLVLVSNMVIINHASSWHPKRLEIELERWRDRELIWQR